MASCFFLQEFIAEYIYIYNTFLTVALTKKKHLGKILKTVTFLQIISIWTVKCLVKQILILKRSVHFRCIWQRTKNPRAPRCIYPKTMGYQIEGQVRSTSQSHQFSIRQKLNKTIFDTDIHQLVDVRVDMYSPKSLRIKVYIHWKFHFHTYCLENFSDVIN